MNQQSNITATLLAALILNIMPASGAVPVTPRELRCEYTSEPVGIDAPRPRLSWVCAADRRGARQTAYQVVVDDMWDSGKVASDQSLEVAYAGKPLQSLRRYTWRVRLWDEQDQVSAWSEDAHWVTGFMDPADLVAQPISAPNKNEDWPTPRSKIGGRATFQWRKEFSLKAKPTSALIAVCQLGYYELYINGTRVGEDVLRPPVCDMRKRIFYVLHDVTAFLREGDNVIGIASGPGFSKGGNALQVQLNAEIDGEAVVIASEVQTWRVRQAARWRCGGFHWNDWGGELVDARDESVASASSGATTNGWMAPWGHWLRPAPAVQAQPCPPNRIGETIKAVAVRELGEGRCEIDFGKDLTGWLRLRMPQMEDGHVVTLYFADRVVRHGSTLAIDKVRPKERSSIKFPTVDGGMNIYQYFSQKSVFVSAGKPDEVFQHRFNYNGFRYVVVEGLPSLPKTDDATAMLIESDLERIGSFACSDDLINRIHAANVYTLRCLNLGGFMVDCPHRERMGYGGDGQLSLPGMMMNFHAARFYEKWAQDWRDGQEDDGSLAAVAPGPAGGGGGPLWPGIITIMPWKTYLHYGNRSALQDAYPSARRYAEYLDSRATDEILRDWKTGGFGFLFDWVPPRGVSYQGTAGQEFGNNCYRVYLWQTLANMAHALGLKDDAAHCEGRVAAIRKAVHAAFYDAAQQRYVDDYLSFYAVALFTGVTPESEQEAVLRNLERCLVEKHEGHLATGMVGAVYLIDYLQRMGRDDLILAMYQKKTYPGWGYMVENGASSFWEEWNGAGTHIHSSFPSADNWLYHGLAGIRPDPAGPGFKRTIIKPAIVGDMQWVKASYRSVHGLIVSNWKRDGDAVEMEVTIPANTTATVYVPANQPGDVTESGKAVKDVAGVRFLEMRGTAAVFEVGSGTYHFRSTVPNVKSRKVAE